MIFVKRFFDFLLNFFVEGIYILKFSIFFGMNNNSQDLEQVLTGRILQNIGLALLNSPVLQRTLQANSQNVSANTQQSEIVTKNNNEFTQFINVCHLVLLLIF